MTLEIILQPKNPNAHTPITLWIKVTVKAQISQMKQDDNLHLLHQDTMALEHLAWAMYDNQLRLGKLLSLSSFESYGQVLQCLVDKAFRGLQACCLACTSAVFKPVEKVKVKSVVNVPQKAPWTERYPMTRDVWEEFAGGDQVARGWEQPLDPETDASKWMKEHQCSYTDAQLDFWLLLRPLTDGGKESSWHLTTDYCLCGTGC